MLLQTESIQKSLNECMAIKGCITLSLSLMLCMKQAAILGAIIFKVTKSNESDNAPKRTQEI